MISVNRSLNRRLARRRFDHDARDLTSYSGIAWGDVESAALAHVCVRYVRYIRHAMARRRLTGIYTRT
ncbi:hypothetical protein D7S86_12250 [Pararobbsia silviterrae]|uniref:Uncharacterized protein n=1 Tax=Pararobbsia silviterrae TaxID=1792498 RepID=A0A494XZI8_9BURK|nr:hypothetical protein D7S86_12250 [Pararobbsia silviterrae]